MRDENVSLFLVWRNVKRFFFFFQMVYSEHTDILWSSDVTGFFIVE